MTNFVDVTELAGDDVSEEQVRRVCARYHWALGYCSGKDVLEVACGTGPGLGLMAAASRSLVAGDISEEILQRARRHYGSRIDLRRIDAMSLPFPDNCLDVVILFEALYYLPDAQRFVRECRRVLRSNGVILISNANKDLFDFNPSPHSHVYHGVVELRQLMGSNGFDARFWGDIPIAAVSWRQKVLRPIKRIVVAFNLMPKSMAGKRLLKRLVFGSMRPFPPEISETMLAKISPFTALEPGIPDHHYKVILCEAKRVS